ncbi:proline dehydrogenase family protein [Solwaraspora sp. WMMB335]|uniref:proline dehydrogenase family protein n=1 Tax=Solwaraspora sp. WMMB335 TaxID=3404118 RepID=UPI003B930A39
MLRSVILAASRSATIERLVATAPFSRDVVRRFVGGTNIDEALTAAAALTGAGLTISVDHLGEDTATPEQASTVRAEYLALLDGLGRAGLAARSDVSVKLSALGQRFDEPVATEHARAICVAAASVGATVTLDMEDHTTTDSTLDILHALRVEHPDTGAVLQAYLRRTEADCRELATPGSRVRLCKGAYAEPESVAYQSAIDVDKSFVRCLNILMSGPGYPMLATHDPRLIAIGEDRARWFDRAPEEFEFQMLYGVRPAEQVRLADEGYTMRIYLPYGTDWYGYLMRRLAERPANVAFLGRALRSRG